MKDSIYLVVNRHGVARMLKQQQPTLTKGERFFVVNVEVADSFFEPKPIPSVNLTVSNPSDIGDPEISVSEAQPVAKGLSETWQAQLKVNRAAARLFEIGLKSGDAETQHEALDVLNGLRAEGINVSIDVPDDVEAGA